MWIHETIADQLEKEIFRGPYGRQAAMQLDRFMKDHLDVQNKHVLVIGSQSPWIETMALLNGAKHVTTLEYTEIKNEIPGISTMLPDEFHSKFLKNELPEFDAMISFSSVEHSGLGRYGDNLNPWGDLIVMARAWCVLKPGGKALVGFPIGPGKDQIYFNSHKNYGPVLLSHLFANWEQVYSEFDYKNFIKECVWCYQDLFVVQKPLV